MSRNFATMYPFTENGFEISCRKISDAHFADAVEAVTSVFGKSEHGGISVSCTSQSDEEFSVHVQCGVSELNIASSQILAALRTEYDRHGSGLRKIVADLERAGSAVMSIAESASKIIKSVADHMPKKKAVEAKSVTNAEIVA